MVGVEVIPRVVGCLDGFGAVEEGWMPLVGVTADEAVEVFEAETCGPEVKRPGLARLPVGDVMVLAIPGCVPTILLEDFGYRSAAFRHDGVVARVAGPELGDYACGAGVMVAASDERRPRWRTERSGVEHIVAQTGFRQFVESGSWNRPAEGGGSAETDVVGHNQQYVRRAFGRFNGLREIGLGFRGSAADVALERRFGFRQDFSGGCRQCEQGAQCESECSGCVPCFHGFGVLQGSLGLCSLYVGRLPGFFCVLASCD
jgi:hypothetical protein